MANASAPSGVPIEMAHLSRAPRRLFVAAVLPSFLFIGCTAQPHGAPPDPAKSASTLVDPVETASAPVDPAARPESACRSEPARRFDPSDADLGWERRIASLAADRSMGVAVGRDGRLAYSYRGRAARVPASNEKLLLSMALLDRFGPHYRIPTRALAGGVRNGTIRGPLWIAGRGDPTLSDNQPGYWGDVAATSLAALAAEIKRAGIEAIDGRVMAARGYFAHDIDAPGWQPYVPHRYVQLPSALAINGNNGGGDPERAVAAALTKELRRAGIAVQGRPGAGTPPKQAKRVAEVRSRPLVDILGHMNRTSDNFFAEMLGKLLGASYYGAPGTIAKGARAIATWAAEQEVVVIAHDSSGLSYDNRVSADDIVELLGIAEKAEWIRALRIGLPGAGEGTLRYRLAGLTVRAKTGSLFNGASALSGWVRSERNERWIAFSILDMSAGNTVEDRIVRIISRARVHAPRARSAGSCGG